MADPIRFYNREFIQISVWGTACLDKLKSMKKIYGHHAFYFMGGHFKSWWWTIRICKENSGKFPMSNTKVAIKNVHNREFIQIDTKHHWHNELPNNSEKKW
jgi:hypothetical protein